MYPGNILSRYALLLCLRKLRSKEWYDFEFGTYLIVVLVRYIKNKNLVVFLRKNSSDHQVFRQIFEHNEYDDFINYVSSYIHPLKVKAIVDLGSNIGMSICLLKKAFPKARVLGVEPEKENLFQLHLNIKANNLKKVSIEQGAIWAVNRKDLAISREFRDGENWSFQVVSGREDSDIKGITLAGLMQKHRMNDIDVLKIDIEGSEKILFENKSVAGTFLPKTKFLVLEVHPEVIGMEAVQQMLESFNFKVKISGNLIFGHNQLLVVPTQKE